MTELLYKPSKWGEEFHALTHDEALGAGSVGPGKTQVLIHEPLPQIQVEHARCVGRPELVAPEGHWLHKAVAENPLTWGMSTGWALHLRRTLPTLEQTIQRCKRIFPNIDKGVVWSEKNKWFKFPSGYTYQFGHCNDIDDWNNFYSNEYCMAKGQRVRMGDMSLKAIEDVQVGDEVMTLEGPKPVSATHVTGRKPCVEVSVGEAGELGTQIHPTTHPVLLSSSVGDSSLQSRHTHQGGQRPRPQGLYWQDYESHLCGLPESPVRRASRVDGESCFVASDGSRQDLKQLPKWSFRVALHAPELHPDGSPRNSPTAASERRKSPALSTGSSQASPPPAESTSPRQLREEPAPHTGPCRSEDSPVCDGACASSGPGTPTGSLGRCSSCSGLRGGRPPQTSGTDQGQPRPRGDVAERSRTECNAGGPGNTQADTPCQAWSYPHFYSGELRVQTEGVRAEKAEARFAGWFETFDLTVEGANHYIAETGLISSQTIICFDELTAFDEEQYDQICSRARSSDPVMRRMIKIRSMSNPNQQHEGNSKVRDPHWVRRRFIDPAPEGRVTITKKVRRSNGEEEKLTRVYIPAKLHDNPDKGFVRDYEKRLLNMPPHMRKALIEGDWYVTAGSFYGEAWDMSLHVCKPFRIPDEWQRWRSMDWGFKNPGCVHWYAMDGDDNVYVEREYTFKGKRDEQVAEQIQVIEESMGLWGGNKSRITGWADTQLWEDRGDVGRSKAATMAAMGVPWRRADKRSRRTNAQRIMARLLDHDYGTTTPGLVLFEGKCPNLIRTLPGIPTDKDDPELPADGGEDHWLDSLCYGIAGASHGSKGIPSVREDEDDFDEPRGRGGRRGGFGYGSG